LLFLINPLKMKRLIKNKPVIRLSVYKVKSDEQVQSAVKSSVSVLL
jgi:hypothetical protein